MESTSTTRARPDGSVQHSETKMRQNPPNSQTPRISIAVDDTRQVRTLNVKAAVDNLNFYYGPHRALKNRPAERPS